MKIGDLLEIIGAACLVAAALVPLGHITAACVIGGTYLIYLGQCHGATPFPAISLRKFLPHKDESAPAEAPES